jgi:Gpi18-like mannosyltransferase
MIDALARARLLRDRDRYLLLAAAALLYLLSVPFVSGDMRVHLIPWTKYLVDHGRFAALADSFADYTPPYLYLLALASNADAALGPAGVIKLLSILGTIFVAWTVRVLLAGYVPARAATNGALLTLLLPTMIGNGPVWGQCDALYGGCVLLAVAGFMRGRPAAAMTAVGLAISFKLQGVFVAPLVLAMLWSRRAPLWTILIPPLVYIAAMAPAWLAGRPAYDLATIYLAQGHSYHDLARSVPNIWQILRALVSIPYEAGVIVGLLAAASAVVWTAWRARRHLDTPVELLLLALTGAVLLPYLLPKMHNRYFFTADLLAFAYAFLRPTKRTVRIAVLVQVGSLLSYLTFLIDLTGGAFVGAFAMSAALLLVLREFRERFTSADHAPSS